MNDNIKLGISRCRLFDFQNVVTFVGEYPEKFDEKEMSKAIKMLSVRQPLIASSITLNENSEAFVNPESVTPVVEFTTGDVSEFVKNHKRNGIDFTKQLFEFFIINSNTLVIFSHTAVSDAKSLLVLALELLQYYNKESVSVEPSEIKLFSSDDELPQEVHSFVADRVTEVLENEWLEKKRSFTYEDYLNAKHKFDEIAGETSSVDYCFEDDLAERLFERSKELKTDVSSLVLFALQKALLTKIKLPKKNQKINAQIDRRPFLVESAVCSVGPFNGTVVIDATNGAGVLPERAQDFHKKYYKKMTLCFNSFYNEVFLSRLSPEFLDSAFFYKAKTYKSKPTKKLATLYGCERKFLLGFESYNLNQKSWEKLSTFHHVFVKEPHKSNENVSATFVMGKKNLLHLEFNNGIFNESEMKEVLEKSVENLKQI